MAQNKSLAKIDSPDLDLEWQQIADKIIEEMGDDLPDQVMEATEYLLAGWPMAKVARELEVPRKSIKGWLEKYPTMALAVANGRKLMQKWRMAQLEQQFVRAVNKSDEILSLDLEDRAVNSKLVATIAQHARFVIGLFAGQQIDVNVKLAESDQTLKAQRDALSYLAEELAKQREDDRPIEATYRVLEPDEDKAPRPLLDHEGNPPFGELGLLDTNAEGTLCHICGDRVGGMIGHIVHKHGMKIKEYETVYMLEQGAVKALGKEEDGDEHHA